MPQFKTFVFSPMLIAIFALVAPVSVQAQIFATAKTTYKVSDLKSSDSGKDKDGYTLAFSVSPALPEDGKTDVYLCVFAPQKNDTKDLLDKMVITKGRFNLIAGDRDYFAMKLKPNDNDVEAGTLLIDLVSKKHAQNEISKDVVRFHVKHLISAFPREEFPTMGKVQIGLAIPGEGHSSFTPTFRLISNVLTTVIEQR